MYPRPGNRLRPEVYLKRRPGRPPAPHRQILSTLTTMDTLMNPKSTRPPRRLRPNRKP